MVPKTHLKMALVLFCFSLNERGRWNFTDRLQEYTRFAKWRIFGTTEFGNSALCHNTDRVDQHETKQTVRSAWFSVKRDNWRRKRCVFLTRACGALRVKKSAVLRAPSSFDILPWSLIMLYLSVLSFKYYYYNYYYLYQSFLFFLQLRGANRTLALKLWRICSCDFKRSGRVISSSATFKQNFYYKTCIQNKQETNKPTWMPQ